MTRVPTGGRVGLARTYRPQNAAPVPVPRSDRINKADGVGRRPCERPSGRGPVDLRWIVQRRKARQRQRRLVGELDHRTQLAAHRPAVAAEGGRPSRRTGRACGALAGRTPPSVLGPSSSAPCGMRQGAAGWLADPRRGAWLRRRSRFSASRSSTS